MKYKVVSTKRLAGDRLRIALLGDIQYGVPNVDIDRLKEVVETISKEGAYVIGTGDYVDIGSPTTRQKFKAAGFYDVVQLAMDDHVRAKTEELKAILEPTKGRWIAMVTGHHNWQFADGTTVDDDLAKWLGTTLLGINGVLVLAGSKSEIQIFVAHGAGGGQTVAAPINKLKAMASVMPTIDIFAIGHFHRLVQALEPRIFYVRRGAILEKRTRNTYLVVSGGYLTSYDVSYAEFSPYTEVKFMPPRSTGSAFLTVDLSEDPPLIRVDA